MGKVRNLLVVMTLALAVVGVASVAVALQGESAKEETPVSEQSGKITFNTESHAVGAKPKRYEVPYAHQLELTLDLEVNGSGEAEFATPPVRFPHGDPPQLRWRKVSPTQVVLIELNDNNRPGESDEYYFKARISLEGRSTSRRTRRSLTWGRPPARSLQQRRPREAVETRGRRAANRTRGTGTTPAGSPAPGRVGR